MKITRSMLEQDAQYLLESVRTTDYEIPQSGDIFKVIFKVYKFVVLVQLVAVFSDWLLYGVDNEDYSYLSMLILSGGSLLVVFGVLCATLYQNVTLALCIPQDVRNKSLLCSVIRKKIRSYLQIIVLLNSVVAAVLLLSGEYFVGGLGASWFFSLIVGGLSFSFSMSRYFTPPVISVLNKIAETVSLAGAEK
ncbi:hypothetical protein LQM52_004050 [Salmonella enterica subsp. enterica serovar Eastbourne]|nr:hypothetical protein [Salmonella enterica subsp. enterica]EIM0274059.1 hypothetical protein [Salmonella enterica]EIO4619064.1 hypothetical protein [Salmonella enterica subsp. enterica serovar Eastbourne]